ncbi:hypothetical protein CsSME_00051473 [Camellia sinensis var. sinensis]
MWSESVWGVNGLAGVQVMWNSRVLEKKDDKVAEYSIPCLYINVEDGLIWALQGVYGPIENTDKITWEKLSRL